MDQDSTGKGSGGNRRNWRERLGINKDLPRLSEEFKTERPAQRAEPQPGRDKVAERVASQPPTRPQSPPPQRPPAGKEPAAEASRPAGRGPGTQVVRPAPMAPRPAARPQHSAQPAPGTPAAAAPQPQRPAAETTQVSARPAQPQRPTPGETTQVSARPAQPQRPTPSLTTGERSDRFAERLKEQREAAERLARQRMEQARAQALSSQQKPAPAPAPGPTPPSEEEKPKFTFAKEEIDQAQRETGPAPTQPPRAEPPPANYGYQPPAQPYGRVPPPVYQPGVYQPGAYQPGGYQPGGYQARPYPPEQGAPQPYRGPAPARGWENEPPAEDEAGAPVQDEYDEERGAPPPARGQVAQRPRARAYAEDDLEDVFDEDERAPRGARRARAEDYSAAYRTYEDEFEDEEEEPRSRGGPLVLLLALIAVALIAGALIYWHFSQNRQTSKQGSNVPVITAPKEPAKTVPPAKSQQQATETPAQQPVHHKKIYDRILGDETLEPERIVPTEETPKTPLPAQNQSGNVPSNGSNQQQQQPQQQQPQSTDQLPLPLPPPPEPSGQQGRLDVPHTTGKSEPQQMMAQNETVIAKPLGETAVNDLAVRKSDLSTQSTAQDLKVPEVPTAEAAQKQVEVAAKQADTAARTSTQQPVAAGDQQQLQQIIETDQPPKPEPKPEIKPQEPRLAAKPKPRVQRQVAVAPPPPQPPAQQPVPKEPGPIALTPFNAPVAQSTPPPQNRAAQQSRDTTETTTRFHGRDSDPLAGKRVPFSSSLPQGTLNTRQPSDLALPDQQSTPQSQPIIQPQPQQQVASIPPQPQQQVASIPPQPQPQPQQPSAASGYVVQLAAFRSQADAQNEYQRIAQAHARLLEGLSPHIQQASLGAAGSFYRLSVGMLPSAEAAQKLCNALISAGERDCLVRRQ